MMNKVRLNYLLRIFFGLEKYKYLRFFYRRLIGQNIFHLQKTSTKFKKNLRYVGSIEGGKTIFNSIKLMNSVIISAGLGEDASFDVEFASKFNATVLILDPTPRAIVHYGKILNRLGKKNTVPYSSSGSQPIDSYDLRNLSKSQLVLFKKALWHKETNLRFFSPPNIKHVSHSISNFQNNYRSDTPFIEVQSTTIQKIVDQNKMDHIELLKLDIEGAEIDVLNDLMVKNIFPNQIIVEYDELNLKHTKNVISKIEKTHNLLIKNGYELIHSDGQADFLYILKSAMYDL